MVFDNEVQLYGRFYRQQYGGAAPEEVFRGVRRWGAQHGGQFGGSDLGGLMRVVGPALAHGAATFLSDAATGYAKGQSLGDAAKGAIAPAILSAVRSVGKRFQGGSGKRKKRKRRRAAKKQDGAGANDGKKRKRRKSKKRQKRGYKSTLFEGFGKRSTSNF